MQYNGHDPVWAELANVDYFLDQLARAVERGEVPRESYDALAPRYLERRADLVDTLQRRAAFAPAAAPAASTRAPAYLGRSSHPDVSVQAHAFPAVSSAREPVHVNWTGVLTGVGALLVIVASAIFSVATWDLFSVGFKIGFLGLLTAGFYGAGLLARTRLDLAAGGVALVAVGSAMLLLDGWIVIDGYSLEGPWPWVVWLAVCSGVYWFTEVKLAGRFFGAVGAAAQVAWVWLLGQGLGWSTGPRMAGIAVVAAAWALAGTLARDREPLGSLAVALRWAAPVALAATVLGMVLDLGLAPAGWPQVLSAIVVGACGTAVVALTREVPFGLGALAHVPALIAVVSLVGSAGALWAHVIVLAVLAAAYLAVELASGGYGHGVLAVVAEAMAWLVLADHYAWPDEVTLVLVAAVAVTWVASARVLEAEPDPPSRWAGADSFARIASVGGLAVVTLATIGVPTVTAALPLAGARLEGRDVSVAVVMTLLWAAVAWLRREAWVAVPVIGGVFYSVAAVLGWAFVDWHSALYASVLLGVALALAVVRESVSRWLVVPKPALALAVRVLALAIVAVGFAASDAFFQLRAWQLAVLFAVSSAFWLIDASTAEDTRPGLFLASGHIVAVLATLSWWSTAPAHGGGELALAAALVAAMICLSALVLSGRAGWTDTWPLGAALAASAVAVTALDEPMPLAASLALLVLAWGMTAYASLPEFAGAAGVAASLCALATLAWLDAPAWVTIVTVLAVSALHLLWPRVEPRGLPSRSGRVARALAAVGALGPVALGLARAAEVAGLQVDRWARIGEQGFVVALLGLAAYCVVAGVAHRVEAGVYVGAGVLVVAVWAELAAIEVDAIAPYAAVLAGCVGWAGVRWGRTHQVTPPLVFDVFSAVIGLIPPALAAVASGRGTDAWVPVMWAIGLSLAAIGLGVALRVRAYFFGGAAALVFVSLARSWLYLAQYWWLLLGIIGIAMLAVALTWERQQRLLVSARHRMESTFEGWR